MLEWCPFAVRDPGPPEKQGYGGATINALDGEIKHSMGGSWLGSRRVLFGPLQRSWTFSIVKTGKVLQHYPLWAVTWHAGGRMANCRYLGVEHEGGPPGNLSEALTPPQLASTIRLSRWVKEQVNWPDYRRHREALEHSEVYATACPSSRIPWDIIIPEVIGMTREEAVTLIRHQREQLGVALFDMILKPGWAFIFAVGKGWPLPPELR